LVPETNPLKPRYEATIVPEGTLALKFVTEHTLDAVVCDLQMAPSRRRPAPFRIERSNPSLAQRFHFITGEEEASRL